MDRTSKKLLDILNKNEPDYGMGTYSFEYIADISGMSESNVYSCTDYLKSTGHLQHMNYQLKDGGYIFGVALTHKRKHYREFKRQEFRRFLLNSILVPLMVALVTAGTSYLIEHSSQNNPVPARNEAAFTSVS